MGSVQRVLEISGIMKTDPVGKVRSHWKGLAYERLYKGRNDEY